MHLEVLVEDASGKILLDLLLPSIVGAEDTFRVHGYKGIGHLPKGLHNQKDPAKRILLQQLPRLLQGYGKALLPPDAVMVVVDLDQKDCRSFKSELLAVEAACVPSPRVLFRIAIEEMEAWLLGDRQAIHKAYPKAKKQPLDRYVQDSICDTWEVLADAIHSGGSIELKKQGWPAPGQAKCAWAKAIGLRMDVEKNASASFQAFRDGVRGLL